MKFAIGLMMQNESAWIKLHLPVLLSASAVDGCVIIDGGSTDDSVAAAESLGATVVHRPWDWKPCDQENAVIQLAEWMGYDCILLTAPDELWWPEHIDEMKRLMGNAKTVALQVPTYNFVKDRRHWAPHKPFFPDLHIRVWRLGQGIRHIGKLDSVPGIDPTKALRCLHLPLYHYSWIKPMEKQMLKQVNFHRVRDGLEPVDVLPPEIEIEPYPYHVPFGGMQPLEPDVIGENAPYV